MSLTFNSCEIARSDQLSLDDLSRNAAIRQFGTQAASVAITAYTNRWRHRVGFLLIRLERFNDYARKVFGGNRVFVWNARDHQQHGCRSGLLLCASFLPTDLLRSNPLSPGPFLRDLLPADLSRSGLSHTNGQLLPNIRQPTCLPRTGRLHFPLRADRLYLQSGQCTAYGTSRQAQFGLLQPLLVCDWNY